MIKQSFIAVCAGVLTSFSAALFAAREEHRFQVSVDIPTLGFYVIPAETDWIHRAQILPWNVSTKTLGGVRKHFDVRHDTSAIEARLDSEPYLSNGRDEQNIYLRVSFADTVLTHEAPPRQVVSAEQARAGGRYVLEIQPIVPAGGYKPGNYYGNVHLIFNAAAP
ncbi:MULTISPECIES: CS1 type fimbrial major subunit [unclassified Pseudomonas]|uniref:CS1 type fimbrial major subunit n=1 Tax=unclassified Pseudomonas TaxID=196821 RepID=UPI002A36044D|nr:MULTISPECIES: CS1 type fimbrial major subunit [unclassified Pseudomonas]MDX9670797.1 CS1 type fimbrial major subunit [Pseudomonas sp. P8_250]WPN35208.1 CS1 type fimbrial major subunit [Pseudomonas sp. P8_139]WPN42992.1 CS1 type fimbrial major subunit [Pseudomonas sp. P8_229]